jgi:hypothetical protein
LEGGERGESAASGNGANARHDGNETLEHYEDGIKRCNV